MTSTVVAVCDSQRMHPGETVAHSSTCSVEAPEEHLAYLRRRMDEDMRFAASLRHLHAEPAAVPEQVELLTWSTGEQRHVTETEAAKAGVPWRPGMQRVTRWYDVASQASAGVSGVTKC